MSKEWTTFEVCPHCMNEVEIPGDRRSPCPECGVEILPCSTCFDDFGAPLKCDWEEEKGCWRYPK
jgi:predicted RNA-binding Zn-ribbon protein involved in translation (DUF1610 family)